MAQYLVIAVEVKDGSITVAGLGHHHGGGIVVNQYPAIHDLTVYLNQIAYARIIAASYDVLWNIVASLSHTLGHPLDSHVG